MWEEGRSKRMQTKDHKRQTLNNIIIQKWALFTFSWIETKPCNNFKTAKKYFFLSHIKPEWFDKPSDDGGIGCLTTKCKVWPSSTSNQC